MRQLVLIYQKAERFFGGLKFAVCIILIFAAALTYGTFMESYHGAEYANRLVYKSLPFMLLQGLMFVSILCASLLRPLNKHFYGFHVIHLGLMTLFLGSFITYRAGVDGSLTLAPNAPARDVQLSDDELTMRFHGSGKEVVLPLPFHAGEQRLGYTYDGVQVLRFLPFAEEVTTWKSGLEKLSSSVYRLQNPNFGLWRNQTNDPRRVQMALKLYW